MEWRPIETVPENEGRPFFCLVKWNEEDPTSGYGMRVNGKWYAGAVFYAMHLEKQFEIREIEVTPFLWCPIPKQSDNHED